MKPIAHQLATPLLLGSLLLSMVATTERSFGQPATGKEVQLPPAAEILDRYVSVTGGKAAYEKTKSRIMEGSLELPAMGMSFKMTIYQDGQGFMLTEMDLGQMGKQLSGIRGDIAWESSAMAGSRIMEGAELEGAKKNAILHPELDWKRIYSSAKTVGVETVDGRKMYKVQLQPKSPAGSKPDIHYYDAESGLLIRTQTVEPAQNGGHVKIDQTYVEWKTFDGIKIPVKSKISVDTQQLVLTIAKVSHNAPIPAEKLELPDDIKRLVERRKKAAEEKKKEAEEKPTTQPGEKKPPRRD